MFVFTLTSRTTNVIVGKQSSWGRAGKDIVRMESLLAMRHAEGLG